MVKYEDFFPYVQPEAQGCPAPLIIDAIRSAVREFCKETWVWQQTVDFEIEAGYREAYVFVPRNSRLVAVLYLLEDGEPREIPDNITVKSRPYPVHFEHEPEEDKAYQARVALMPSEDSTECLDWFLFDHSDAIAAGAKFRLLRQTGKPWSNPEAAMTFFREFETYKGREKIVLLNNYSQSRTVVSPKRFI